MSGAGVEDHLQALERALAGLRGAPTEALGRAAVLVADQLRGGGRLLSAGNGGSAAEAQHLAGELIGRLAPDRERGALPAVALTADTGVLTAVANDYGFDEVFARQIDAHARAQDVLVVLSTSGASRNLVRAVEAADAIGMPTIGLLGGGDAALHRLCGVTVAVPSTDVQTIQECHLVLIHQLVALVEEALFPAG